MLPIVGWEHGETRPSKLVVRFQGTEYTLGDGARASVTLGRAEDNDMVIKGNLISRLHARIEHQRSRFMLVDESTNGTFLQTGDGEEVFVRRDSTPLTGEGVIGLGRVIKADSPQAVRYRLVPVE